ncbi:protein LYK2 isoform X1 [Ziziphus jujuba]|uniref:Protein LYK2 isoform X1 n=1 Tax=Ziziphus jujuba TaxID=326968 RepID=A0A6P4AEI2_ZIZJJ|nr:protein LYK2 isoform X1 [Ziziphus jujuba]
MLGRVSKVVIGMAAQISKLQYLKALVLFIWLFVPTFSQTFLSCENSSPDASGYHCNRNSVEKCGTFAILRTNSYFSSLFNLSFYLGIDRLAIAEANGFSARTEFLPKDQPLLIPIDCKCNGGLFQAELTKTTTKGESFDGIAESLEGLTTCKAIQEKNPGISPRNLDDKVRLLIPLRCACPSSEAASPSKLLLSYPVNQGDTICNLAVNFNTTREAIISANNRSLAPFIPENLVPLTSILIPLNGKPIIGSLAKPHEPNLRFPGTSIPVIGPPKKKSNMWKIALYIALSGILVGVSIAVAAAFLLIQLKKRKQTSCSISKGQDLELQQLSQSVRTTSEKKVSFDGSHQEALDNQISSNIKAHHKALLETYTIEELRKATENFHSSNHIGGSVYNGRLNGKNLAVKRIQPEIIPKIDFGFFIDAIHHHPNILRLLGTCLNEGSDSFLVFEYARNGSLKDWLHGGLAIKNQFIASCYCFLTWSQRLKICLDVAMALQYMHQVMDPVYVHRNVKTRNIFLDEEFNAKLGNFGMARCAENDTAEDPNLYSTNPASWSLGYLAPEYIHQGIISPSLDIFAYGVVLLEVLSGQTPISRPNEKGGGSIWLAEKIKPILESENGGQELRDWMDNALGENYSFDAALSMANLARVCIEEEPSLRPSVEEIIEKISRLINEDSQDQGEHNLMTESSSKPLVKAAATTVHGSRDTL